MMHQIAPVEPILNKWIVFEIVDFVKPAPSASTKQQRHHFHVSIVSQASSLSMQLQWLAVIVQLAHSRQRQQLHVLIAFQAKHPLYWVLVCVLIA